MSDIFFFLKIMFLTMVAVLFMQIRWGGVTVEHHAMRLLTASALVTPIDDTAQAAVVFIRNSWNKMTKTFNTKFSNSLRKENQPGTRLSGFDMARSEVVKKTQQKSLEENFGIENSSIENNSSEKNSAVNDIKEKEFSFENLKKRARQAGSRIRSQFIDETKNPGQAEDISRRGAASATPQEDESIDQ